MVNQAQSLSSLYENSGLTRSQLNIWIGQSLTPDSSLYNMAFAFKLRTAINVKRFAKAWQTCVDASDSLRTSVVENKGQPIRVVLPEGSCPMRYIELDESPKVDYISWAKARALVALPLNGELLDSVLVRIGENEYGWYLNQHHLITDASSTVHLVNRVLKQYNGELTGYNGVQPVSYYELCENLDRKLESKKAEAQKYWKQKQPNRTTPISIYGKRHLDNSTRSERVGFTLGKTESEKLKSICGETSFQSFFPDISLFAVFSTLFAALLKRISGESEISFDAPFQCRPTPESKECIGCFIELFPLSISIGGSDSFNHVGEECMAEVQGILANALPGTRIPSDGQYNNAVLNFFPAGFDQIGNLGLKSDWLHSGQMDSIHDFRLLVHDYDKKGEYTFQFELDCGVFTQEKRLEIVESFKRIIEAFISSRETIIDEINVLPRSAQQTLFADYNEPSIRPVPEGTIIERFLEQVNKTPDRIAVRDESRSMTFKELSQRVDTIARKIRSDAGEEAVAVGVYMKRSIDVVVTILAILRSGNHYIPIDPSYPKERIQHIVNDSGLKVLITHRGLSNGLPVHDAPAWNYEDFDFDALEDATGLPLPEPDDLAYVIYTSGSTGKPKGVEIEHRGLIDYIDWAARQYVEDQVYSFPLFTSLSFDLTVTSLYLPLATGGTLIIYEETEGPIDSSLISVISDNAVQILKLTPSHLSLLRQMDLSDSRIEKMVLGGEDLKCELAGQISEQFQGKISIFNEYGPTEAVVGCMIHKFDPNTDPKNGTSVPIGVPADHVKLYVLNDRQSPVPAGVAGELYIARNGLARGYRNNQKRTAQVFLKNPFDENERCYRTGDLVRFNENHKLVHLGRTDDQIKISGHRIEPGEIVSAFCTHPNIADAYVTSTMYLEYPLLPNNLLVGYYVSKLPIDKEALIHHLAKTLHDPLIPSFLIRLNEMPLTINGKVDKNRLPNPNTDEHGESNTFIQPSGPVEEHVAKIWSDFLPGNRIGANDDFFKLGGTSLSAMEVSLQICNDFDIDLPLQMIFRHRTVSSISSQIEEVIMREIDEITDEEAEFRLRI